MRSVKITRKTDGKFGNVSGGVLFSEVVYQPENGGNSLYKKQIQCTFFLRQSRSCLKYKRTVGYCSRRIQGGFGAACTRLTRLAWLCQKCRQILSPPHLEFGHRART